MITTVILDFDGTIGDTRALILKTMHQTIGALGLEPRSDEQCAAMIGLPLRRTFTDLIPMDDDTADKCVEVYRQLFDLNNTADAVKFFPHVIETIKELHAMGITLTIASSRARATLQEYVKSMGLSKYISYIISVDDNVIAKPAPDMVIRTLRDINDNPENALVVGDTTFDIEMGKGAGALACGVTYGNGTRKQLEGAGADYVIDDFADIIGIVNKSCG